MTRFSEEGCQVRTEVIPAGADVSASVLDRLDGFIAERREPWIEEVISEKPVILIDDVFHLAGAHSIVMDHEAAGLAAAQILDETLSEHFAYCHHEGTNRQEAPRARQRLAGFEAGVHEITHVTRAGGPRSKVHQHLLKEFDRTVRWLDKMPKPLGILAYNDVNALRVLRACAALGLRIPDDVAVVGIDKSRLICSFAKPPLSSIESGLDRLADEAIRLLVRLLDGRPTDDIQFKVPITGVELRESTGHVSVDDPVVAKAMEQIRHHGLSGITVDEIAKACGASVRTLELHFKEVMGYPVAHRLSRFRHTRAKKLLRTTELTIDQIGARIGLPGREFRRRFRDLEGCSPSAFRRH